MKRILTIIGPTAAGKTRVCLAVAKKLAGEIVSADSRQIYKHLTIGTAKPTNRERQKIPFHLIDFLDPAESYSCGQFARDANRILKEIHTRKNVPIVCGGTGLYIRALFHPLHSIPVSDPHIKKKLYSQLHTVGLETFYHQLESIDPQWALQISPHDTQRIVRGLEVYEMTGQALSSFLQREKNAPAFLPYYVGITKSRDALYRDINSRYDRMIAEGLIEEVESLLARGYAPDLSAMRTIGYKELVQYLHGHDTRETAIEKAKRHTRNLAKRQLTWFKKLSGVIWCDADEPSVVDEIVTGWKENI